MSKPFAKTVTALALLTLFSVAACAGHEACQERKEARSAGQAVERQAEERLLEAWRKKRHSCEVTARNSAEPDISQEEREAAIETCAGPRPVGRDTQGSLYDPPEVRGL